MSLIFATQLHQRYNLVTIVKALFRWCFYTENLQTSNSIAERAQAFQSLIPSCKYSALPLQFCEELDCMAGYLLIWIAQDLERSAGVVDRKSGVSHWVLWWKPSLISSPHVFVSGFVFVAVSPHASFDQMRFLPVLFAWDVPALYLLPLCGCLLLATVTTLRLYPIPLDPFRTKESLMRYIESLRHVPQLKYWSCHSRSKMDSERAGNRFEVFQSTSLWWDRCLQSLRLLHTHLIFPVQESSSLWFVSSIRPKAVTKKQVSIQKLSIETKMVQSESLLFPKDRKRVDAWTSILLLQNRLRRTPARSPFLQVAMFGTLFSRSRIFWIDYTMSWDRFEVNWPSSHIPRKCTSQWTAKRCINS